MKTNVCEQQTECGVLLDVTGAFRKSERGATRSSVVLEDEARRSRSRALCSRTPSIVRRAPSLPVRVDTYPLQLGACDPIGSQCSHRDDLSVDIVDEEIAAGIDVARRNVVKVAV